MQENNYRKRYAFEWFMKEEDKRYWNQTQELVKKRTKPLFILTTISIVITIVAVAITIFKAQTNKR